MSNINSRNINLANNAEDFQDEIKDTFNKHIISVFVISDSVFAWPSFQ